MSARQSLSIVPQVDPPARFDPPGWRDTLHPRMFIRRVPFSAALPQPYRPHIPARRPLLVVVLIHLDPPQPMGELTEVEKEGVRAGDEEVERAPALFGSTRPGPPDQGLRQLQGVRAAADRIVP